MTLDPAELDCQDVVELITEYLEGGLSAEEREQFKGHIAICEGCETYIDQMRTTLEVSGSIREEDVEPEAMGRLLDTFREWKKRTP